MRRIFVFVLCFMLVVLAATLVQAGIESCKTEFKNIESVYVKSTLTRLCNNVEENEEIKLYIVEDKDAIPLAIVKDLNIFNSKFSCTEIWSNPTAGSYDVFVDCIDNENYDVLEPFASFKVVAVTGSASASFGEKNPQEHIWRHDPEEPDLTNEMLQIKLKAVGEDIEVENITISASGTGNDVEIDKLEIYIDTNNNGKLDENEELVGDSQPAYLADEGVATIFPDLILEKDSPINLLVVYVMKETISEGKFSLNVQSISGKGAGSQEIIRFSGTPLSSATKTVLPEKTCLGQLTLVLEPNPATRGERVTATISGLAGCEGKKIILRPNPCGSSIIEEICSCAVEEGKDGCGCSFIASKSLTYHSCVDKNQDGDMIDFGEYDFQDLIIEELPEIKAEENVTEETNVTEGINITEGEEKETAGLTRGIIEEIKEKVSTTSSLFILLEVTLLLILLVLVMIMFRLKPKRRAREEAEEKKE